MRIPVPKMKASGVKHSDSTADLESGPLLDKDEQQKQLALQDVPGRMLGMPIQLVAGIFYCCGEPSEAHLFWRAVCITVST